jgi:hypothetical protein
MNNNDERDYAEEQYNRSLLENPDPPISYIWQQPTHVVVDTIDGYVYKGDTTGLLFDGPRAAQFAHTRNNEQNPGFRSFIVFRLEREASFEPVFDNPTPTWNCRGCGQEWPVRSSAEAISQNAKAAVMHPGEDCRPATTELEVWAGMAQTADHHQCDTFECDGTH